MSYAKCLVVFLAAVASVNGLATGGHMARHSVHRRSLAARVAEPEAIAEVIPALNKRAAESARSRRRCKPRPSGSSLVASATPVKPSSSSKPASSSTKAAEVTTAIVKPKPVPSSTPKPKPVEDNGNLPSFMRGVQTGEGTYFETGLGACGYTTTNDDLIAAVSLELFDNFPGYAKINPNKNPMCGRTVTAHYQGKSVTVKLVDRCTGCKVGDLDFSYAAFLKLSDFGIGRLPKITWTWD